MSSVPRDGAMNSVPAATEDARRKFLFPNGVVKLVS
jgi:hypothetical protein